MQPSYAVTNCVSEVWGTGCQSDWGPECPQRPAVPFISSAETECASQVLLALELSGFWDFCIDGRLSYPEPLNPNTGAFYIVMSLLRILGYLHNR